MTQSRVDQKRRCRICGGETLSSLSRSKFERCSRCRSTLMALSEQEYSALSPTYDPGPLKAFSDPKARRAFLDVETRKRFLRSRLDHVPRPTRFLDIGCGAGGYLLAAHELGCEVVGVEPSSAHSTIAREVLGFNVVSGYFDLKDFVGRQFEVVMLSHVIEHIYHPAKFIEGVLSVVAPGGLLIIVTPNADSTIVRVSGARWPMLQPIDHVSMLSAQSFQWMGVDRLGMVEFSQSEYVWETAATLGSIVLTIAREGCGASQCGGASVPSSVREGSPVRPRMRWRRALPFLRYVLAAISMPVYLVNRATGRQACLIVDIRRPSGDEGRFE